MGWTTGGGWTSLDDPSAWGGTRIGGNAQGGFAEYTFTGRSIEGYGFPGALISWVSPAPPALSRVTSMTPSLVCAVNAAIFIEGQTTGAATVMRYLLAGLTGGLIGTVVMALGIGLLPAGPRNAAAWWPMLITGTLAGTLLALDNALGLDQISLLYPVWQAGVALRLVMALRF